MDKLKIEPKAKFVGHLDCITKLERKCIESKTFSGKKADYIGTMVRVNERDVELGTVAIAYFETTIAIEVFGDSGIIELFMKELDGCNKIVVFDNYSRDLIQKYNHKNIEVILE